LGFTPKQEVVHSVELFHDYIRDGRIKLKGKIKEPTTVQDPCNVIRSGGLAEKNQQLAKYLSEDFRPMKHQGELQLLLRRRWRCHAHGRGDEKKTALNAAR